MYYFIYQRQQKGREPATIITNYDHEIDQEYIRLLFGWNIAHFVNTYLQLLLHE